MPVPAGSPSVCGACRNAQARLTLAKVKARLGTGRCPNQFRLQ